MKKLFFVFIFEMCGVIMLYEKIFAKIKPSENFYKNFPRGFRYPTSTGSRSTLTPVFANTTSLTLSAKAETSAAVASP